MPQFQSGELVGDDTGRGVGEERGDVQSVEVGEVQLPLDSIARYQLSVRPPSSQCVSCWAARSFASAIR
jgi:hypothetical protein